MDLRWSGWKRILESPASSLAGAGLAALLCGLFLAPLGLLLAALLLVALLVGFVWPWLSVRSLAAELQYTVERCREGEPIEVRLLLVNRLPLPAWGVSLIDVDSAQAEPCLSLRMVPGWRAVQATWKWTPGCRGRYPRRPFRLVTGFPFGLWHAQRELACSSPLIVWPRIYPVAACPEFMDGQGLVGNVPRARSGHQGESQGVRPYRRGDSPRRIHWAQTARQERLIVQDLQVLAQPTVRLVLDTCPDHHVGHGSDASLEWAIRVAASLACGWQRQGVAVDLLLGDRPVPLGPGHAGVRQYLDALACYQPDARPRRAEAWRGVAHACVVVTTDRATEPLGWPEDAHWVVLHSCAFDRGATSSAGLSPRHWLDFETIEEIPARLRNPRKETRRGA